MRARLALALLGAALLLAGFAGAHTSQGEAAVKRLRPKPLWATINICDTRAHPNTVGVRGRMSARSRRTRMYMRFSLQYYDPERGAFVNARDFRSPLLYVGRGLRAGRQLGFSFGIEQPPATGYLLRGRIEYFWYRLKRRRGQRRRRQVLIKRRSRITRGGKKNVREADPPGFSAGVCDVR